MPQANGHYPASMTVTDTAHRKISDGNRIIYQRLKQALSLGLRRQIFVAVCDDLTLRNRLAARLHAELAISEGERRNKSNRIHSSFLPNPGSFQGYPRLVSLNLNLSQPHPIAQINRWLAKHPPPDNNPPGFQILGVELLTKQPATVQGLFLRSLRGIERSLPRLESSLLLWMPRPWFRAIQQSAPEFWRCHTGLFEFEGEPTPVSEETWYPSLQFSAPREQAAEQETAVPQENLWHILNRDFAKYGDTRSEKSVSGNDFGKEEVEATPPGEESQHPATNSLTDASPVQESEDKSDESAFIHPSQSEAPHQAIENLPQVQSLQEIAQLQQQSCPPEALAEAYLRLGNHYRDLIELEQSNTSQENLIVAIQAYEQALSWLEADSPLVPDTLNDLGNLYWMLARYPSKVEEMLVYLEQGIQAYQTALTTFNPDEAPHTYAMIQNNLGAAYGEVARYRDAAENLQYSIGAYQEALRYRPSQMEPLKYAATHNNLGTAYWHLAQQQQPVTNLQQAIASYTEALLYYNPEQESLSWAMLQNNIGTAYWNLAQYEQPATYLKLAIEAYLNGLKYRTPDVVPAACAATHNNLGTAYWHLASQVETKLEARQEYLQSCITAYETAIALVHRLSQNTPPVPVTFDASATYNNLGLAHYQMATDKQFALAQGSLLEHLEAALHNHLQALRGFSAQPDAYASTLSYIVQTIRAFFRERGLQGQNLALSKVPGKLLPELLRRL
ncbi:tetratricopeptide repeat protein [Trichocoleus sp. AS-A2]